MNTKTFQETARRRFSLWQRYVSNRWNMFVFTPARYWKSAFAVFVVLFFLILAADALIFWSLAITPKDVSKKTLPDELSLEHDTLKTALMFLNERGHKFAEAAQISTSTLRNMFTPPAATGPKQEPLPENPALLQ